MSEEERIREMVLEYFQIDESLLVPELSFDELAVDSLTMLELLTAIEEEFDIHLDDECFEACENYGQMCELIMERIRNRR